MLRRERRPWKFSRRTAVTCLRVRAGRLATFRPVRLQAEGRRGATAVRVRTACGRCALFRSFGGCGGLDHAHGAIVIDEGLVSDATDVCFCDLVDAIDLAEEFAPVAIAGLVDGEIAGETAVAIE